MSSAVVPVADVDKKRVGAKLAIKCALVTLLLLINQIKQKLVEAAGVEPASEKARREKNYVRFQFGSCRPPH